MVFGQKLQLYVEHSIYSSRHCLLCDYATLLYPTTQMSVKIISIPINHSYDLLLLDVWSIIYQKLM